MTNDPSDNTTPTSKSSPTSNSTARNGSALIRLADRIAGFSHPFYAEERQRDVWNAATAVAYQVLLWSILVAAPILVYFQKDDAVPAVLTMLALIGISGWVAIGYARHFNVNPAGTPPGEPATVGQRISSALAAGLVVLTIGQIIGLAASPKLTSPAFLAGFVTGLLVVAVAGILWRRHATRVEAEKIASGEDE